MSICIKHQSSSPCKECACETERESALQGLYDRGYQDGLFAGRLEATLAIDRSMSEREEIKAQLNILNAHYDALTRLNNKVLSERDELKARVEQLEAERESWGNEFNAVIIMKRQLAVAVEALRCISSRRAIMICIEDADHVEHFMKPIDAALAKIGASHE